jgi:hypothetical protein
VLGKLWHKNCSREERKEKFGFGRFKKNPKLQITPELIGGMDFEPNLGLGIENKKISLFQTSGQEMEAKTCSAFVEMAERVDTLIKAKKPAEKFSGIQAPLP